MPADKHLVPPRQRLRLQNAATSSLSVPPLVGAKLRESANRSGIVSLNDPRARPIDEHCKINPSSLPLNQDDVALLRVQLNHGLVQVFTGSTKLATS